MDYIFNKMSNVDLLKYEIIDLMTLKIFCMEEELTPIDIIENVNIKGFKDIEHIYFRDVNKENFEIILMAIESEGEKDLYTRARPPFLIRISKNTIEYIVSPINNLEKSKDIIENLSATGDILNISIFRLDKKEKTLTFDMKMGFKLFQELDIQKFRNFFKKINNSCNEIKNAKLEVKGLGISSEDSNFIYNIDFSEEINNKDEKKKIELLVEFKEVIDKITFADICIQKYVKRHIIKINEILNNLIGE